MPRRASSQSLSSSPSSSTTSSSSKSSGTSKSSRSRSSSTSKSQRTQSSSKPGSPSTSSSSSLRTQSSSRSSQTRRRGGQRNQNRARGRRQAGVEDRRRYTGGDRDGGGASERKSDVRPRRGSGWSTGRNGSHKASYDNKGRRRRWESRSRSRSGDRRRYEREHQVQRNEGDRYSSRSRYKIGKDGDNGNRRDYGQGKVRREHQPQSRDFWGGSESRRMANRDRERRPTRSTSRDRHDHQHYHGRGDSRGYRKSREDRNERQKSPVAKRRARDASGSPGREPQKRRRVEAKEQVRERASTELGKANVQKDPAPYCAEGDDAQEPRGSTKRSKDAVQASENFEGNPQDTLLESSRWGSGPRRAPAPKAAVDGGPNFGLSGKLAEESRKVKGIVLKFTEPPEARKPDIRWRLYTFKGGEFVGEPIPIHRQSSYLFGRDRTVADIPTDHPSCSKQHSALQFRLVEMENADGTITEKIKPYLMDLESVNGTFINREKVEPHRYYELLEQDTIRFGLSSREYVLLHEGSIG